MQFSLETGQPVNSFRFALGSQLIKEQYHLTVEEISMNQNLQSYLGAFEISTYCTVQSEHDDALAAKTDVGPTSGCQRCDHHPKESEGDG